MGFEELEPIFGELNVESAGERSVPSRRFLYHVHAADPAHLRIVATDFHSNTWEAVRSIVQLEDMVCQPSMLYALSIYPLFWLLITDFPYEAS